MSIHESVVIEDGAKIASDVVIGPFCTIGKNVEIKSGSKLESNIILKGKIKIDENVRIFSFTAIGNINSNIKIGKRTHIREFSQIGTQENESKKNKKIIIGNDNFLMAYTQIMDGVKLGDFCIITNAVKINSNVTCHDKVIIGGMSTIEENNKIGAGVMIGGASVINTDIPPFTLVEGNKATIKGLNIIGLRRRVEDKNDIEEIKAIYKNIFSNKVDKKLAEKISNTHENKYVKIFTSFIAKSNL